MSGKHIHFIKEQNRMMHVSVCDHSSLDIAKICLFKQSSLLFIESRLCRHYLGLSKLNKSIKKNTYTANHQMCKIIHKIKGKLDASIKPHTEFFSRKNLKNPYREVFSSTSEDTNNTNFISMDNVKEAHVKKQQHKSPFANFNSLPIINPGSALTMFAILSEVVRHYKNMPM